MLDAKLIKKIKFEYRHPDDYKPLYVNGVIGGPTAKNDIILNFFVEANSLPDSQVFEVVDGKISGELLDKRKPSPIQGDTFTIIRHMQTGIILNISEAAALHKWLGEQINTIQANIKK